MRQIYVVFPGFGCQCVNVSKSDTLSAVYQDKLPDSQFYAVNNGKLFGFGTRLEDGQTYHIVPKLLGGKGGFGSMLRALGAQIEKTTNREACRDISGRRMRDVNNEQKLRDWVAKASDREKEKELKKRERQERRRAEPRHTFDDPEYAKQKSKVKEGLEDALHQGLQKASTSTVAATQGSRKRKSQESGPPSHKKLALEWLGVDDLSDVDTDSDSELQDNGSPPALLLPVAGPSRVLVPDSGAVSGASSLGSDHDSHSDSGVESVAEVKHKGASPMEVDSDSTKDSAMNSDTDIAGKIDDYSEVVSMNSPARVSTGFDHEIDAACSSKQHGLLTALEAMKPASERPHSPVNPADVDLRNYEHVDQLEALGLDTLKAVLMSKAMKCGGTLKQRAERLWAVRGLASNEIDPSLLAKPSKGKGKKN